MLKVAFWIGSQKTRNNGTYQRTFKSFSRDDHGTLEAQKLRDQYRAKGYCSEVVDAESFDYYSKNSPHRLRVW